MTEEEIIGNKLIGTFMGWELVNLEEDEEDDDFACWVFKNKSTGAMHTGIDAEFYNKDSFLPYNLDWRLLMEAIDKIESIGEDDPDDKQNYHVIISKRLTRIIYDWATYSLNPSDITKEDYERFDKSSKDYRFCLFDEDKRKATFQAVVDFVEWYNTHNHGTV